MAGSRPLVLPMFLGQFTKISIQRPLLGFLLTARLFYVPVEDQHYNQNASSEAVKNPASSDHESNSPF